MGHRPAAVSSGRERTERDRAMCTRMCTVLDAYGVSCYGGGMTKTGPRITVSMAGENYRVYRDGQWVSTFTSWVDYLTWRAEQER